ncbi:MAG: glutamate--cysteine ligase [Gemmatimonadetes bacterium]|nr:glutamate--cysteine ligase [Gemmatimonadota bacterium]
MSDNEENLSLFSAYGVELEYGIVDLETFDVAPVADRLLARFSDGDPEAEIEFDDVAWSNELVLHVLEMKTNGPRESLADLARTFQENATRANEELASLGATLLPSGMHPWMDPETETRLWPHEYGPVYRTFDRIFGCRGHGWSNLQSTHLNLPFRGDEEFARLHEAIRLVLPLIPALTASSPIADGKVTGFHDTRLEVYRHNARRVPSVSGVVVPESVATESGYEALLQSVYRDLAPHDPEGVLRHPWVNARGAIARFDRGSIEIRIIDSQECPAADVAAVALVGAVVRALVEGALPGVASPWAEGRLAEIFLASVRDGDDVEIADREFLRAFGHAGAGPLRGRDLWAELLDRCLPLDGAGREWREPLDVWRRHGTLARRILDALGRPPAGTVVPRPALVETYRALARSLARGISFVP